MLSIMASVPSFVPCRMYFLVLQETEHIFTKFAVGTHYASALCWLSHAGGTVHQTFNTRWSCLPSGFGTCVEQPAIVCQECTVADDVPSRTEDCTFSVVIWQWLGDRDCTAQYNCCLPTTTDCRRFCRFICFSYFFILYGAPAMFLTW